MTDKEKKEIEANAKELAKIIDESSSENGLTPYQNWFVFFYSQSSSALEAVKKARKKAGVAVTSNEEVLRAEANALLMLANVKKAISKVKSSVSSQTEIIIANTGNDLAEAFKTLSTDNEKVQRIEERIKKYDILIDEAEAKGDTALFIQLDDRQRGLIKIREKIEESVRKNLALVHEMTGTSKTKQIIRAGALNINMGNGTINNGSETKKHLETIEADFSESFEDIPDIDELKG